MKLIIGDWEINEVQEDWIFLKIFGSGLTLQMAPDAARSMFYNLSQAGISKPLPTKKAGFGLLAIKRVSFNEYELSFGCFGEESLHISLVCGACDLAMLGDKLTKEFEEMSA